MRFIVNEWRTIAYHLHIWWLPPSCFDTAHSECWLYVNPKRSRIYEYACCYCLTWPVFTMCICASLPSESQWGGCILARLCSGNWQFIFIYLFYFVSFHVKLLFWHNQHRVRRIHRLNTNLPKYIQQCIKLSSVELFGFQTINSCKPRAFRIQRLDFAHWQKDLYIFDRITQETKCPNKNRLLFSYFIMFECSPFMLWYFSL